MPRSAPAHGAPGARTPKACLPCAKVKARCEIEPGDRTCTRCRRLEKACSGQVPGAHRRPRLDLPDVSRLDESLHDVAVVLAASQPRLSGASINPDSIAADLDPAIWIGRLIKDDSEGEAALQTYRTEYQPFFPFVVLQADMSFTDWRETKPFLLLVVLMITSPHNQARQLSIAKKLRHIISYSVLIKGNHSLDILQGLLIFVNWYQLHLQLGSQLCNLIHLVMAMMTELGLNKSAVSKNFKLGLGLLGYFGKAGSVPVAMATTDGGEAPRMPATRTLEERRTFVGCFFLTSIVSICKRDIEPIRYSRYLEECCQALSGAGEYTTDLSAVQLAHLHVQAGRITQASWYDDRQAGPAFNSAPIGASVKVLESELQQLKSSFSDESHQNASLLMHYYLVEVLLYETALDGDIDPQRYGSYPFARLNMLHACLNSTKLCFDTFSSFPISQLFNLPYTIWTSLEKAIVVLSRLSSFQAEGWDHDYVRSILDFAACMDMLSQRIDEATAGTNNHTGQIGHNSLPRATSRLFSGLKAAHNAKYTAEAPQPGQIPGSYSSLNNTLPLIDEFLVPPTNSFFDFLEEEFWQQFP